MNQKIKEGMENGVRVLFGVIGILLCIASIKHLDMESASYFIGGIGAWEFIFQTGLVLLVCFYGMKEFAINIKNITGGKDE